MRWPSAGLQLAGVALFAAMLWWRVRGPSDAHARPFAPDRTGAPAGTARAGVAVFQEDEVTGNGPLGGGGGVTLLRSAVINVASRDLLT